MTTVNTGAPGAADDATGQPTTSSPRPAAGGRPSRAARVRRGIGMVAVIAAGAGVIGLGTGVGSAAAEPAPAHAGWDGSRYWFKDSSGHWRWTAHYDVYLARSGGSAPASGTAPGTSTTRAAGSSGGITQGWDGSRYWFRNSQGQWRWTSHYDVYLERTGGSEAGAAASGSSSADSAAASSAGSSAESSDAAPASGGDVESAVDFALAQLGKPFRTAGNGPDGFDCSGLVQQSFRRAGVSLPRVANDQYAATTPVTAGQLRRGDLLFWSDDRTARGIHHVAIYLGNNQYVEAARPGTSIRVSRLSSGYYPTHMGRP
ncbi:C40 family peptidase [Kitasatospora sp. NPDC001527]|uniref:C40 family peptidase n=1 Tax=Kitasatospora sp. NPDC001527 TaxID=3154519 RepID=UPI0033240445